MSPVWVLMIVFDSDLLLINSAHVTEEGCDARGMLTLEYQPNVTNYKCVKYTTGEERERTNEHRGTDNRGHANTTG